MALAEWIIGAESGGNPNARNPRSSAGGAGQFIDSTWLATLKKHRPDIASGKTDAQLLQLKYDPALSREMTDAYARDNQNFLTSRGFKPTAGNSYLAHFAGPTGAAAVLADPAASVEATLGPSALAANPFLRGKTNADLAAWAGGKMSPGAQRAKSHVIGPAQDPASGAGGPETLMGGSGMDKLTSALSGSPYDPRALTRAEEFTKGGAETAKTASNWLDVLNSAVQTGYGEYLKGRELPKKQVDEAQLIETLSEGVSVPPAVKALLKSSTPEYRQAGMEALLKLQGPKAAPDIKSTEDVYGRKQQWVWNAQTGRYEPFQMGGGSVQPATPALSSPAPIPSQPEAAPPAPMLGGPNLPTENVGEVGAMPAPMVGGMQQVAREGKTDLAAPAPTPQSAPPAIPAAPAQPASEPSANFTVGPAVPKAPEGYIHKIAPNGSGYLYDQVGNPVFESKAEADTRARLTETRGNAQIDAEKEIGGVKNIISTARALPRMAGFNNALALARAETGMTVLGQSVDPAQIGYTVERARDPNNPVWGAYDAIKATEEALKLKIARPLMKGQGQVSNSERQLIADAIGNLRKASNPADFQFRLNSLNQMIEDMNTPGREAKPEASYNSRPTRADLTELFRSKGPDELDAKTRTMAGKYNVPFEDMKQYAISQWEHLNQPAKQPVSGSALLGRLFGWQ